MEMEQIANIYFTWIGLVLVLLWIGYLLI